MRSLLRIYETCIQEMKRKRKRSNRNSTDCPHANCMDYFTHIKRRRWSTVSTMLHFYLLLSVNLSLDGSPTMKYV